MLPIWLLVPGHALHVAAVEGRADRLRELIKGGMQVDAIDDATAALMTPLLLAAVSGQLGAVKVLLELGASPHATEASGFTPLHFAAQLAPSSSSLAIAVALLDAGAKPAATDRQGRTALHMSSTSGHKAMAALLCRRGMPLAATDHDGNTALHSAGSAEVATLLLERAGRQLALLQNRWNDTAMHEAAWAGRTDLLQVLAPAVPSPVSGADVPSWARWDGGGDEGRHGETPLVLAARQGHAAATQLLLRHAFCLQEGGKLSCPGIKHAAAKRTLAHLLQEIQGDIGRYRGDIGRYRARRRQAHARAPAAG